MKPFVNKIDQENCLLPTDNYFNIPTLRLDRQPIECTRPFFRIGEMKRNSYNAGKGTLCFYQNDNKFKNITVGQIIDLHPENVVEVNESIFDETDIIEALTIIKNKRTISRILQDTGHNVIVDLHVSVRYSKINLIGVPDGYASFCTRGTSDTDLLEFEYNLAKQKCGSNDLTFIVYGGGQNCIDFCRQHNAIYVVQGVKMLSRENKLKIKPDMLPIFDPIEVEEEIKKLWESQIINFKTRDNG